MTAFETGNPRWEYIRFAWPLHLPVSLDWLDQHPSQYDDEDESLPSSPCPPCGWCRSAHRWQSSYGRAPEDGDRSCMQTSWLHVWCRWQNADGRVGPQMCQIHFNLISPNCSACLVMPSCSLQDIIHSIQNIEWNDEWEAALEAALGQQESQQENSTVPRNTQIRPVRISYDCDNCDHTKPPCPEGITSRYQLRNVKVF